MFKLLKEENVVKIDGISLLVFVLFIGATLGNSEMKRFVNRMFLFCLFLACFSLSIIWLFWYFVLGNPTL